MGGEVPAAASKCVGGSSVSTYCHWSETLHREQLFGFSCWPYSLSHGMRWRTQKSREMYKMLTEERNMILINKTAITLMLKKKVDEILIKQDKNIFITATFRLLMPSFYPTIFLNKLFFFCSNGWHGIRRNDGI